MKIPFLDKEKLIIKADKEHLLRTIGDHTDSDDKKFERMFTGRVGASKFRLYRVKKFGLMDYSVTLMKGEVRIDRESVQVELTFSLMWWYAGQILAEVFFIILFAILIGVNSNSELRDVSMFALIGIPIIIFTILRYKWKYEGDKEKYKSLLEKLAHRSNVH